MTRKAAVIGSTRFPIDTAVGAQVVDAIRDLGPDVAILTRGSGTFEQFVATVALTLGLRCFEYPGEGGYLNFVRDAELVTDCDELLAFLDPATLDDPHTGTAMVIERALSAGKPVRAASAVDGNLVWVES